MDTMNRWNQILFVLSVVVIIDVFFVLKKDFSNGHALQDGILPTVASQAAAPKNKAAPKAWKPKIADEATKKNTAIDEDNVKEAIEKKEKKRKEAEDTKSESEPPDNVHKIAGLNCDAYGGPSEEVAAEMVYWQDIPSDANFISPFKHTGPEPKYLTFEPDEGGWNNIRMSMETAGTYTYFLFDNFFSTVPGPLIFLLARSIVRFDLIPFRSMRCYKSRYPMPWVESWSCPPNRACTCSEKANLAKRTDLPLLISFISIPWRWSMLEWKSFPMKNSSTEKSWLVR